MSDKMRQKLVVLCLTVFFFGMVALCLLKPADSFSESERRKLAQPPAFTMERILSGKFQTQFEDYAADQFPFRESLRRVKALTGKYVLGQSDNHGVYVKDGYVSKLEYPLQSDSLSYAASRFQYIYDTYLAGTEVKPYFAIIPDKNYFLSGGQSASRSDYLTLDYAELVAQMQSQTEFLEYIDIWDCLSLESYYRTDTHWRQDKLLPVAQKIAGQMGVTLSESYQGKTLEKEFYGVYYGQAALPLPAETIVYLTSDSLEQARVYDYQNQKELPVYDMEKAFGKDPYELFLSGSLSLLTIENGQAETERELVVFRDSFGSSLIPLLAEGYRKITVVDIRYLPPQLLRKYIAFGEQDVLFLYSTLVLNHSETLK